MVQGPDGQFILQTIATPILAQIVSKYQKILENLNYKCDFFFKIQGSQGTGQISSVPLLTPSSTPQDNLSTTTSFVIPPQTYTTTQISSNSTLQVSPMNSRWRAIKPRTPVGPDPTPVDKLALERMHERNRLRTKRWRMKVKRMLDERADLERRNNFLKKKVADLEVRVGKAKKTIFDSLKCCTQKQFS